jgi:hypothetical protein
LKGKKGKKGKKEEEESKGAPALLFCIKSKKGVLHPIYFSIEKS